MATAPELDEDDRIMLRALEGADDPSTTTSANGPWSNLQRAGLVRVELLGGRVDDEPLYKVTLVRRRKKGAAHAE